MLVTVNVHEAKTQLSRLLDQAAQGREVVIAKAGRPVARLVPVEPPPATRPLGFLVGRACAAADLKRDFAPEIEAMFGR